MRLALRILAGVAILYAGFVVYVYALMRRPPEDFARGISKIAAPVFLAAPFETLWTHARGGSLQPGAAAPDFQLHTVDRKKRVRLSAFRGVKPVVLIFGSYT
jgi:hypothetical protein